MLSAEKKFRVPIIPDCLWEIVGQCDDADDAFIVAMLRLIKKRFDGEPAEVPAEYRSAWRLIEGSLTRIEEYRNRKRPNKDTDHDAPSATMPDHDAPSATMPDHDAPKATCNGMEGNGMEGNVSEVTPQKPPKGGESDPEFEIFWEAYGKKEARKDAERAFAKAKKAKSWPGIESVLAKVAEWRKSEQWTKDGGHFQPRAASWLNGERWNDELPQQPKSAEEKLNEKLDKLWMEDGQ